MTRIGLVRATVLLLIVLLGVAGHAAPGGTLHWRMDRNEVDADVASWALPALLEEIATTTGWEIYVEPGTEHTVTTRFEKLPTAEALRRLLDGLSFALLPQVAGPPKLFVYQGSVDRATERVRGRAARRDVAKAARIADERIVVLKKGRGDIERLARRLGATVVGRVDALGAYRLRFENAARASDADGELTGDPDVESVEANYTVSPPAVLQPLAASSGAPIPLLPDISPSEDKVIVGLIDTPVQGTDTRVSPFLQAGVSVYGEYQSPTGSLTHGTAMAETILDGVARALAERGDKTGRVALSILPVDVYGASETTNMFSVAQGVFAALERHVNVVNLSLGGDTDSPLLRSLLQRATERGVVIVAAAGNEPVGTRTYPAADPGVIAVTASDASGGIASYANTGHWVDAMAPGDNVLHYGNQAWYGTGTSFSSSWVSGWTAGYLASPGAQRAAAARQTLQRWGLPPGTR